MRDASLQELAQTRFDFHDEHLPELLFRYRAQNWPDILSAEEAQQWEQFCHHRLHDADGGGSITLAEFYERIALLRVEREGDAAAQRIMDAMDAMDEWGGVTCFSGL